MKKALNNTEKEIDKWMKLSVIRRADSNTDILRILTAFNDGYALPTKVMLKSLILNNTSYQIEVYVLYCSLMSKSIASLKELESERVMFIFRKIENETLENFPLISRFTKEIYIRLFAHEYLDELVDRILWLDGDIIVNGDIKELYEQDFEGNCYIAVKDMGVFDDPYEHDRINLPKEKLYVNAGVLLMNLPEIRKKDHRESIIAFLGKKRDSLAWLDQDILNGVFYNDIKVIDPQCKFNFFANKITLFNEKQILKEKRIIHYISSRKPWKEGFPFGGFKLWWHYRTMLNDSLLTSDIRRIQKTHIKQRIIREVGHNVGVILKACSPQLYKKCRSFYSKLLKKMEI